MICRYTHSAIMPKVDKCKCGSTDHSYKNHPNCKLNNKDNATPRAKPVCCPACKLTTHFRSNSLKCPMNKVFNNF